MPIFATLEPKIQIFEITTLSNLRTKLASLLGVVIVIMMPVVSLISPDTTNASSPGSSNSNWAFNNIHLTDGQVKHVQKDKRLQQSPC